MATNVQINVLGLEKIDSFAESIYKEYNLYDIGKLQSIIEVFGTLIMKFSEWSESLKTKDQIEKFKHNLEITIKGLSMLYAKLLIKSEVQ